jgi:hypothetical protein
MKSGFTSILALDRREYRIASLYEVVAAREMLAAIWRREVRTPVLYS